MDQDDAATTELRLHLTPESDLEGAISEINGFALLRRAELCFAASFREKKSEDVTRFMESLCRRPTLQQLRLASDGTDYYCFPVWLLCTIFNLAIGLEKIELQGIELSGNEENFSRLEVSLQNHSALRDIICTSWLSEETRMKENLSLDHLVKALAASRSLQSISLQPTFTFGRLGDASVGLLGTLAYLKRLNISKCNLTDQNMVALANVLRENTVLEELQVSARLGEAGIRSIADFLRANDATLQVLVIHDTNTRAVVDSSESSSDVHNNSPSSASAEFDTSNMFQEENEDQFTQVARALQDNETLKHFALYGAKLSEAGQASFVEMMKQNYTLESLSLLELSDDKKNQIDMYALLNRCGRKELLGSAGSGDWVESLAMVSDDLDCLFYLISTKPSLCDLESDNDAKKRGQNDASSVPKSEKKKPRTSAA